MGIFNMNTQEIFTSFYENVIATKWQEWTSTIFQIASVWYAKKNNILVYPTGIIGVLLAAYVYFYLSSPPLYADCILNLYYLGMSIYGWYNWTKKKNETVTFPISWCGKTEWRLGILLGIVSWGIIYWMLIQLTDSNTPGMDSLVAASALTSMYWMAKRKIENWIGWVFSNMVAIPLNFYKGFMLFTLMYILFLGLAISGYQSWKKEIIKTN